MAEAAKRTPRTWTRQRIILLIAFTFTVMADPVSSVAYAIEAALRALDDNLSLLFAAMALVVIVVALVVASYHALVGRFPEGGGSAAAAGTAFGEGVAFIPMGALIVDFVLTIAISVSAGSSALIAYFPGLAQWRLPLALALLVVVSGIVWFGHLGRTIFATLTIVFLGVAVVVLLLVHGEPRTPIVPVATEHAPLAVLLAFPVAMALATGVEAPSSAIAQLGQLNDAGRRSFGRWALWLTLGIVGTLTLGLTAAAVYLGVTVPHADTTLVAEIARRGPSPALFGIFQIATALLLLSAAASSFQAGPGLLKALARHDRPGEVNHGVLPAVLGRTNRHHVPVMGLVVFLVLSALVVTAAGAYDQRLVLFYAVSVFVSFLMGLTAMLRFEYQARRWGWVVLNAAATVAVGFTLLANLTRPEAVGSLVATAAISAGLYAAWVRAGRPRGAANAVAQAEAGDPATP